VIGRNVASESSGAQRQQHLLKAAELLYQRGDIRSAQSQLQHLDPDQLENVRQTQIQLLAAKIDLISPVEMKHVPKSLSSQHGGYVNTVNSADGADKPMSTTYQVRVPLNQLEGVIAPGSTGLARIRTGNQT